MWQVDDEAIKPIVEAVLVERQKPFFGAHGEWYEFFGSYGECILDGTYTFADLEAACEVLRRIAAREYPTEETAP